MMRVGVACALAIAGLTACGFHSPQADSDALTLPSVDAQVDATAPPIDARGVDAAIDGGTADRDGDGVPDATDNCVATGNPDQHDEDHDSLGDVCDPCPQIAGATLDGDGDGIADACDPHPTVAGDALVRFEPFTGTGNLPPGWQKRAGGQLTDWTRGDDAMAITAGDDTPIAVFDTGSQGHAIDVGIQVVSGGSPGLQYVTVLTDARSDLRQFFSCGMRFDGQFGGRSRELIVLDQNRFPPFEGLNVDFSDAPTVPGPYRIQFITDDDGETCVIPKGSNPHRQFNPRSAQHNTFVGLRANAVTVQFQYVAIYKF